MKEFNCTSEYIHYELTSTTKRRKKKKKMNDHNYNRITCQKYPSL